MALGPTAGGGWIENVLRPILIAGMIACIGAPLALVLETLVPGWDGSYWLAFAFVAGLEGIWSERILKRRRITGWAYVGSRATELLFLLLVLKLLNYIPLGMDRLLADAARWPLAPESFLTDLDLFAGALFVLLWAGAIYAGRTVSEIELEMGRSGPPPGDLNSPEYYMWLTQPSIVRDRQERLEWLGELFLWGGMALLAGATLVHVLVSSVGALGVPILLYFALGVALLSQAQFSVKHAAWQMEGTPVQQGMARRWLLAVLVFLVVVALVALVLPTGYAVGPFQAIRGVLSLLVQLVVFGFALLFFLVMALLALLFPRAAIEQPPPPAFEPELPPLPAPEAAASLPWLQILGSALFWLVILAIAGYALVRFVRERWPVLEEDEEGEARGWRRLLAWLRALWRHWRGWRREALEGWARRRSAAARRRAARRPARFFSLRSLGPRELVRYFYVSTTRRAAQAGQPRRPSQTPYEYEASLGEQFPDLEPDLSGLTEAFVEARYGRATVEPEDVERVKPLWQRIKAALRRRRETAVP